MEHWWQGWSRVTKERCRRSQELFTMRQWFGVKLLTSMKGFVTRRSYKILPFPEGLYCFQHRYLINRFSRDNGLKINLWEVVLWQSQKEKRFPFPILSTDILYFFVRFAYENVGSTIQYGFFPAFHYLGITWIMYVLYTIGFVEMQSDIVQMYAMNPARTDLKLWEKENKGF